MVKVIVYPMGEAPRIEKIQNTIGSVKKLVGGLFVLKNLGYLLGDDRFSNYVVVVSKAAVNFNRKIYFDAVPGQFAIMKLGSDDELTSITEEEAKEIITLIP